MDQLDEEANEAHDGEADSGSESNFLKLFNNVKIENKNLSA
jgi:hypothetical protein